MYFKLTVNIMTRKDWDYLPVRKPIVNKMKKYLDQHEELAEKGVVRIPHFLEYIIINYFEELDKKIVLNQKQMSKSVNLQ